MLVPHGPWAPCSPLVKIDINEQNPRNIEQIREGLNKEFECNGPLLSFHALMKVLQTKETLGL
jgi:hypothetical protein